MCTLLIEKSAYKNQGLAAWYKTASLLLKKAENRRVWCFYGDLGAAKTTCIQALCHLLGVQDVVQSPTFGLVHTYGALDNKLVYHFDLYRLKNKQEVLDIGMEEYLESGHYCFIEWPSIIQGVLPDDYVDLYCTITAEDNRRIKMVLR